MKLNCASGFDIDIMRANNPRLRFQLRRTYVEITPKFAACPDCGEPMADGGACGYYCTTRGCDHDTLRGVKRG